MSILGRPKSINNYQKKQNIDIIVAFNLARFSFQTSYHGLEKDWGIAMSLKDEFKKMVNKLADKLSHRNGGAGWHRSKGPDRIHQHF